MSVTAPRQAQQHDRTNGIGQGADEPAVGSADPRESMLALPRWTQLPLTLLTGKAHVGQQPPLRPTPTFHLVAAFTSLIAGTALSALLLTAGGWWLTGLPVGWAVTLHGMRNLRMMIFHQCAHRNMYGKRRLDMAIGQLSASLLLVQNFRRYSAEHVSDHHAVHHMTLRDPTVQAFLISLDLHPGMSVRRMRRRLLATVLSPKFHARFAAARLRSFLHGSGLWEKVIAAAVYGGAVAAATATGDWQILVVGWLVPLVPLFQVSNTLRLCVKHTFPAPGITRRRGKAYFGSLTNAIFLGETVPPAQVRGARRLAAWLRWFARMTFVHFPARYLVLTGDTVVHDFHHRYPSTRQWANYIFERQRDLESGCRGWPAYRAAWGLVPAINLVFESLSAADPAEFDAGKIRSASSRELFAAFDD